jgi:hypothetical protein
LTRRGRRSAGSRFRPCVRCPAVAPAIDAVQLQCGESCQVGIQRRARYDHQRDLQIPRRRIARTEAVVEIDLIGLEWRLPVHLEREHLTQVVFGGDRQREFAAQRSPRRDAIERAQIRIVDLRAHVFDRRLAFAVAGVGRHDGCFDTSIAGLPPDGQLIRTDLQQQRFGTLGEQPAPARRQQRHQFASPPGEKARQRRSRIARPQAGKLIVDRLCQRHLEKLTFMVNGAASEGRRWSAHSCRRTQQSRDDRHSGLVNLRDRADLRKFHDASPSRQRSTV